MSLMTRYLSVDSSVLWAHVMSHRLLRCPARHGQHKCHDLCAVLRVLRCDAVAIPFSTHRLITDDAKSPSYEYLRFPS